MKEEIMEQLGGEGIAESVATQIAGGESPAVEERATAHTEPGSIGKFRDTASLLSAYNSLQAEFTRKCQRLAELESAQETQTGKITFSDTSEILDYFKSNTELQNEFFKAYIQALPTSPTVISNLAGSGIPLNAPPKPTTLEEAKALAKRLL